MDNLIILYISYLIQIPDTSDSQLRGESVGYHLSRPNDFETQTSVAECPAPSVILIPATPVDPKMIPTSDECSSDFQPKHQNLENVSSELSSISIKTTSAASNPSMSRTSSAKSRRSSKSSMKADKKSKISRSFGNLSKLSSKIQSDVTGENKSPEKSSKRSIKLMNKKSMRLKSDDCQEDTNSDANSGKAKNNFYKVLDKIRGISRRSSLRSGGESSGGGQSEFLASISRMSDSRIVENWLLSIDDDQVSDDPPPLETLGPPEARPDQATPTNQEFDTDRKATIQIDNEKQIFKFSSNDSSEEDVLEDNEHFDRRQSMFKPVGYGRQISESSEYTTDTHDTNEIAQMTAINTIRNTSNIFTSVGDELKKVNLSPGSDTTFRHLATVSSIIEVWCYSSS